MPRRGVDAYAILGWPNPFTPRALSASVGAKSVVTGSTCTDSIGFGISSQQQSLSEGEESVTVGLATRGVVIRAGRFAQLQSYLASAAGTSAIRLAASASANEAPDAAGTLLLLEDCQSARSRAANFYGLTLAESGVAGTTYTTRSALVIPSKQAAEIAVGGGRQIVTLPSLTARGGSVLTLSGLPDTTLIVRLESNLVLQADVQVLLTGGLTPAQVMFLVGNQARIGAKVQFRGSVLAANTIRIGAQSLLEGQFGSSRAFTLGGRSSLTLLPFSGWGGS